MNLRKLGGLVALAFVVFYAITNPHDAAAVVRQVATGAGAFFSALADGGS